MVPNRIRPVALCAVRSGERVLLAHGFDSAREERFYRPPGGTIEFGERAADAVRREFREELGAELDELRLPLRERARPRDRLRLRSALSRPGAKRAGRADAS